MVLSAQVTRASAIGFERSWRAAVDLAWQIVAITRNGTVFRHGGRFLV